MPTAPGDSASSLQNQPAHLSLLVAFRRFELTVYGVTIFLMLLFSGLPLGALAAFHGSRRSAAQKVAQSPELEAAVVDIAERRPDLTVVGAGAGLQGTFSRAEFSDRFDEAVATAERAGLTVLTVDEAAEFRPADGDTDAVTFVRDGLRVMADHEDRTSYPGALAVVRDATGHLAFERQPVTRRRLLLGGLLGAAGMTIIGWLALPMWTTAALAALLLYGISAAYTDHDTLLIDLPTFFTGTTAGWALLVTARNAGELSTADLVVGAAGAAGWMIIFTLMNVACLVLRGTIGIGFGDALMVLATVGLPTAALGMPEVAVWSVLASMLVALAHRLPSAVVNRGQPSRPFAMIPYLASGWLVTLALIAAAGW